MAPTKQTARKSTGGPTPAKIARQRKAKARRPARARLIDGCETGIPWAFVDYHAGRVLVQWKDGPRGQVYDDTWEAAGWMRLQGFDVQVDLVAQYKAEHPTGDPENFMLWCKGRPEANYIGASHDGRCAFRALQRAMNQLENAAWTSDALVDAFAQKCQNEGHPLPKQGVSWPIIRSFVHFANLAVRDGARQLAKDTFEKNLLPGTVRSVEELDAITLTPGVYLCAAFNQLRVGHCFTIVVFGDQKLVLDEEDANLQDLITFGEWVAGVYFLRKVELF